MYFSHNGKTVYSDFSLQPVSADADVESFKITLGNEEVLYNPSMPNAPTFLEWPSTTGNTLSVKLNGGNENNTSQTFNTPWGWPQLVNQYAAFPLAITDKEFDLVFKMNQKEVRFRLVNKGKTNPYALTYLQKSWMPHWVFKVNKQS